MPPVCSFEQERALLEAAFSKAVGSDASLMSDDAVHTVVREGLAKERAEAVLRALRDHTNEGLNLELKTLVEHCLCRVAIKLVAAAVAAKQPVMSYCLPGTATPAVSQLLDLGLWLSTHSVADPGMIFTLLEQLVEGSTLANCQDLFSWVERRHDTLNQEILWKRGKLIMLRTCNDLLRRLSKANNTVLCGRVLITLAHFFELSERSALNLSSKTNTHPTKCDEDYDDEMDTGEGAEPVDRQFHKEFWALQVAFQTPQSLVPNPAHPAPHAYKERFDKFHTTLNKVLTVFESQPLRDGEGGSGLTALDGEEAYAVKYLTSSKLLHLQLRDPAFRRHFLLQCLILTQYLQMPPKAENVSDDKAVRAAIAALEERLWGLLKGMGHGEEFVAGLKQIMQREKNWVQWKRQVCPAFERFPAPAVAPAADKEEAAPPRFPLKRKARAPVNYRVKLGNQELDRLWSLTHTNTEVLASEERKHVHTPSCEDFFAVVIEEADPEAQIEAEYKKKNDTVFKWKAHRLIAKAQLQVFTKWSDYDLDNAIPEMAAFKGKVFPGINDQSVAAKPDGADAAAPTPPPDKAKQGGDAGGDTTGGDGGEEGKAVKKVKVKVKKEEA